MFVPGAADGASQDGGSSKVSPQESLSDWVRDALSERRA